MYADSQAFFALPGKPPIIDPQERPKLSVALLTSVPPFVRRFGAALAAHDEFKKTALANKDVFPITCRGDIPVCAPSIGALFGMQDMPEDIETSHQVGALALHGVQFMSLAYDKPTRYGFGFLKDGPLTEEGKKVIAFMGPVRHPAGRLALEQPDRRGSTGVHPG